MKSKYFRVILLAFIFLLFIFGVQKALNVSAEDYDSSYINSTTTPTCFYTYSEWSLCSLTGKQTRTFIYKFPLDCIESVAPVLEQYCSYAVSNTTSSSSTIPACSYIYSDWSLCSSAGIKTRTYTKSPADCLYDDNNPPITEKICETYATSTPVACSYIYSDWSLCSSAGIKTRTYTKSPPDCLYNANYPPVTKQTCAPSTTSTTSVPVCSYTYSDWSLCDIFGKQTRKIISKLLSNCLDDTAPTLERKCVYSPVICENQCDDWTPCNTSGIRTRACVQSPAGCAPNKNNPIITKQACSIDSSINKPCSYIYSDWSLCDVLGRKTRKTISKFPAGCVKTNAPVLEMNCDQIGVATSTLVLPSCNYYYSAWSDCILGVQTRIIISKSQGDCREVAILSLDRSCKATSSVSNTNRPADAPKPAPEAVTVPDIANKTDFNERTSAEWQQYYFAEKECLNRDTCGGNADPDNDGLNNNEEYRFGTDPKDPDSDHDGLVDAGEIQDGRNPLAAPTEEKSDKMTFENPKDGGDIIKEIYQVVNVQMVSTEGAATALKISGKALPNTFVTIYIYSDPIVLTVKTDSEGNWSFVLDKPLEEGTHEVYVGVTDAAGKIAAKSEPLMFVQTAQAVTIIPSASVDKNKADPPTKARLTESYVIFLIVGILGLVLAFITLGTIKSRQSRQKEE